ncbi:MAG TPA: hypothetical protein VGA13_06740 [Acidimicrobiales bacterium]
MVTHTRRSGPALLLFAGLVAGLVVGLVATAPAALAGLGIDAIDEVVEDIPTPPAGDASTGTRPATAPVELDGLFRIAAGSCDGEAGGSWFRMRNPSGGTVTNSDSSCQGGQITLLSPGTDGGLLTGEYQALPESGLPRRITEPTAFFGNDFGTSTNPSDPQTGTEVGAPVIFDEGGSLSGDLRSFEAFWNGQHFNQGSPKPDGSSPGATEAVTGTYDPSTGAYSLEWASHIEGGPFNGFSGEWHLAGVFEPDPGGAGAGTTQPQGAEPSPAAPGTEVLGETVTAPAPASSGGSTLPRTGPPFDAVVGWAMAGLGAAALAAQRRLTTHTATGPRR